MTVDQVLLAILTLLVGIVGWFLREGYVSNARTIEAHGKEISDLKLSQKDFVSREYLATMTREIKQDFRESMAQLRVDLPQIVRAAVQHRKGDDE